MIWVVAFILALGVGYQHWRLSVLKERLLKLSFEVAHLAARRQAAPEPLAQPAAPALAAPEPPETQAPLDPAPARPLPAAAPRPASPTPLIVAIPSRAPADTTVAPPPTQPPFSVADWLSEHGLAWLGGGVLGLGGLLLVGYAAHQGFFTPALRIGAAVVIGVAAMGAGEWLRRRARGNDGLVAALSTAAGAVILYGATWASHGLYGFIPAEVAGGLLAIVSLGLLALSGLHGQPLALLAVAGAYVTPVVSGVGAWTAVGLDGYALLILVTGVGAAAFRGWPGVAAASLAGAGCWALARFFDGDPVGTALLAAASPVLTLARPGGYSARGGVLTLGATVGAAVMAMLLGFSSDAWAPPCVAALITVIALVGAWAVRMGRPEANLLPAAAALGLAAMESNLHSAAGPAAISWLALPVVAVLATALDAGRRTPAKPVVASLGAVAVAFALTVADGPLTHAFGQGRAGVDLLAALLVAGAAVLTARRSRDARRDAALPVWIGAAAEIVGLALHAAIPSVGAPIAYAALAATLAGLALRPGWRGFAEASSIAALASFVALLGPADAIAALTEPAHWPNVVAVCVAAVVLQVVAWRLTKLRGDRPGVVEALSTLAILSGLVGVFIALRAISGGPGLGSLDGFTAASLRSLVLLVAGLTLMSRPGGTPLGRLRGPVLLAIGGFHAILFQFLALHPWWGAGAPVAGTPVIDALFIGLLAPALILGEAGRRTARSNPTAGVVLGALALVMLLVWEISEIRRLFHGPSLQLGPFGYAETAFYAVALLATSALVDVALRRFRPTSRTIASTTVQRTLSWLAGTGTLLLIVWAANPWWGPIDGVVRQPLLLALAYVAAAALTLCLAREAQVGGASGLAACQRVSLVIQLFTILTVMVRYVFNGGAMRSALVEESLETWMFSAIWALLGLGVLAVAAMRSDRPLRWTGLAILLGTTGKVFLFDLDRLSGVARAASFLALGAVLLIAALAARRLRERPTQAGAPERPNLDSDD